MGLSRGTRRRWLGGAPWLATLVGCDGVTGLGALPARDAAADGPAVTAACAAGALPGLRDEEVDLRAAAVRAGEPTSLLAGQTLVGGGALALGDAVYWGVADDRCGRGPRGTWWGARVAALTFDPDRRITARWACFDDTWGALHVSLAAVGDGVGLFYARHALLVGSAWVPQGVATGRADLAAGRLEPTWDVNDVQLAAIRSDGAGHDVVFARAGERFYQRLDAAMGADGPELRLGPELRPGSDTPLRALAAGDAVRSIWKIYDGVHGDVEVVTHTRAGERRGAWTIRARTGVDGHASLHDAAPVDGGFVGVVSVEREGATDVYLARFCDDGPWAMRRFARHGVGAALVRHAGRWVVLLAEHAEGAQETTLWAHVLDDDGRRLALPRELDASRELNVGALAAAPATRDLVALYTLRPSADAAQQARAVRVTVEP